MYTKPCYTVYFKLRVLSVFPLNASTHFHIETPCNYNLTEGSLIISLVEGSLEHLKFPLLKFNFFFNTPIIYFLKYFCAKLRETLKSGSREIG